MAFSIADPKAIFDTLKNYLVCGALIAVGNLVGNVHYYRNCGTYGADIEQYSILSANLLYATAILLISWNSAFAIKQIWNTTKGSTLYRIFLLAIMLPVIYQIATLLPLKEFSSKEAAIERDRYGRTYTTSIADKMCKLENQLDELSNELSQMREKIDGTPSYLHQKQ